MTFDPAHFASPGAHDADQADADFYAEQAERDRFAEHGPALLPTRTRHGSRPLPPRPVVAGREVSPAIAEFLAAKQLGEPLPESRPPSPRRGL